MRHNALAVLSLGILAPFVSASPAPIYPGFKLVWSDGFPGSAGESPNTGLWNIITKYTHPPSLTFITRALTTEIPLVFE